ncbi:hypothetical protein [uncultured Sphingomonas sp.]|uniref:hypothetical protein n=1 Tax=uncultured Sphingomonas sp. TaxID=158754 RepID=UPI0035C9F369
MIDEPEAPHVAHGKSGIVWLDLSLAVAVLVLSAASLLTAQHTGHTMEKLVEENSRLVRANATPVLQFFTGNVGDDDRAISLSVANVGTGTARVISFEIEKDGVPQHDPFDLIDYQPHPEEQDYVPTRPVAGSYFPAGETRQFLTWRYPNGAVSRAKWNAFDSARTRLRVTACYCSVLGECWVAHLAADQPQPVKACMPRDDTDFRESPAVARR